METEEKLCIKVLRTLQQMLVKRNKYGERVSSMMCVHPAPLPGWQSPPWAPRGAQLVLPWPQPWHGDTGDVCLPWQGNLLRKMLMNNYLQNKRSSSKGEMGDAAGGGECPFPAPSPQTPNSQTAMGPGLGWLPAPQRSRGFGEVKGWH